MELLKTAFRSLWRKRVRSLLTMGGIVVGVSLVSIVTVISGKADALAVMPNAPIMPAVMTSAISKPAIPISILVFFIGPSSFLGVLKFLFLLSHRRGYDLRRAMQRQSPMRSSRF